MVRSEYMLDAATLGKGETIQCGPQKLVFIPPRRCYLELCDPMTVEDCRNLIHHLHRLLKERGRIYTLVNMTAVREYSRDVRELANDMPNGYGAVAIVSRSFPLRITTSMMLRAARLLKPNFVAFAVDFFATDTEANAWLEKLERETEPK